MLAYGGLENQSGSVKVLTWSQGVDCISWPMHALSSPDQHITTSPNWLIDFDGKIGQNAHI